MYPSVEHAYQAAKTLDKDRQQYIRNLATPNLAKKAGRKLVLREDWEQVKVPIMRELLREKFSQEPEKLVLLATGNEELVEGNWWGDQFWGQSPVGVGENWLGRLLMEIRTDLREGAPWLTNTNPIPVENVLSTSQEEDSSPTTSLLEPSTLSVEKPQPELSVKLESPSKAKRASSLKNG